MIPHLYIKDAGAKGLLPLSPAPQIPADPASASLRTISLDDSEHLLHNHHASVASLRLLFTFAPECRSPSLRNRCSPSPEYPVRTGVGLSHTQWHPVRRHEPAAQVSEASRPEAGYALAQLAHAPTNSCHATATRRRFLTGRSGAVGPYEDVHYARNLHPTHCCNTAAGGRKSFAIGDKW
jgi:hypothetical protein